MDSLKLKKKALNTSIQSKKEQIKSDYNDFTAKLSGDIQNVVIEKRKSDIDKILSSCRLEKEKIKVEGKLDVKGMYGSAFGHTRDVLDITSISSKLIDSMALTQNYKKIMRDSYNKNRDNLLNNLYETVYLIIKDFKINEKYAIKNILDDVYKTELENKIKIEESKMPETQYWGKLIGYEAEKYYKDVINYIKNLEDSIKKNMKIFEETIPIFENIDITKLILSSITEEYTLLEKEILDKENSLIQRRLIKDGLDQI